MLNCYFLGFVCLSYVLHEEFIVLTLHLGIINYTQVMAKRAFLSNKEHRIFLPTTIQMSSTEVQ